MSEDSFDLDCGLRGHRDGRYYYRKPKGVAAIKRLIKRWRSILLVRRVPIKGRVDVLSRNYLLDEFLAEKRDAS